MVKKSAFLSVISKEGKINSVFLFASLSVFVLMAIAATAMTVTLNTPASATFSNLTSRNINFTFTPVWSFGGADPSPNENVSNCSIYTTSATGVWNIAKNFSMNSSDSINVINNNTISWANFTFSSDANYTWNIGCLNSNSSAANITFGTNRTLVVDVTRPSLYNVSNITNSTSFTGVAINFSANVSDYFGIALVNWSTNVSGTFVAITSTSTPGNATQISGTTAFTKGGVFNFTIFAIDYASNINQSTLLITVSDTFAPTMSTARNTTVQGGVINLTANLTEETQALLSANLTYNISGVITKINYTVSGLTAQVSNFTTLPSTRGAVTNFTFYATDIFNNVVQSSLLVTSADITAPTISLSAPANDTETSDSTPSFTFTATDNADSALTCDLFIDGEVEFNDITVTSGVAYTNTTDALSDEEYRWNVSCTDLSSNTGSSTIFRFTVDAPGSSGSSGGGGGGASSASANTAASTARVWSSVAANTETTLTVTKAGIAVSEVTFTVNDEVMSAELSVASLKKNPLTTTPSEKVFQYLSITPKNMPSTKIEGASISFVVPASWVSEQGVSKEEVVLYRYAGGKWNALETSYVTSSGSDYEYQSLTPGFSTFAIGSGEVTNTAAAEETEEETTEASSEPATTETSASTESTAQAGEQTSASSTTDTQPAESASDATDAPSSKKLPIIAVALVIIIIIAIVIVKQKK